MSGSETLLQTGQRALQGRQWSKAAEAFGQLVRAEPGVVQGWLGLGITALWVAQALDFAGYMAELIARFGLENHLELLVPQLNAVKEALREQVRNSRYTLMHMVERKARVQISTAWLKIEPVDLRPYPTAPFH